MEETTYKRYRRYGLMLDNANETQYKTICPFCERDKFYINKENGLWDCKHASCEGSDGGNYKQFLQHIFEIGKKETLDVHYRALARIRVPLTPQTLRRCGVFRCRFAGHRWVVPIFNSQGTVEDLRVWSPAKRVLYTSPGAEKLLWNYHEFITRSEDGRKILLTLMTEGEWDGMAAWQFFQSEGVCVLALPGAMQMTPAWASLIAARSEHVVMLLDNDEAGQKGSAKIARLLEQADPTCGVSWLRWTPHAGKRDVRDLVAAQDRSIVKDNILSFQHAWGAVEPYQSTRRSLELPFVVESLSSTVLHQPKQRYLHPWALFERETAILYGRKETGKGSWVKRELAAFVSGVMPLANFADGKDIMPPLQGNVLFITAEETRFDVLSSIKELLHSAYIRIQDVNFEFDFIAKERIAELKNGLYINTQTGIHLLEKLITLHKRKYLVVVLDPLNSFMTKQRMDNAEVRRVYTGLDKLCDKLGCAIWLLAHPSKSKDIATQLTPAGNSAWIEYPRTALYFAQDMDEPNRKHVFIEKNNRISGEIKKNGLAFDIIVDDNGNKTIKYMGLSEYNSVELINHALYLEKREGETIHQHSAAKKFLLGFFKDLFAERNNEIGKTVDASKIDRAFIAHQNEVTKKRGVAFSRELVHEILKKYFRVTLSRHSSESRRVYRVDVIPLALIRKIKNYDPYIMEAEIGEDLKNTGKLIQLKDFTRKSSKNKRTI